MRIPIAAALVLVVGATIPLVSVAPVAFAGPDTLADDVAELERKVDRLAAELEEVKNQRVPAIPQAKAWAVPRPKPLRAYPWEPYYDGFAFEPKAHFIGGTK